MASRRTPLGTLVSLADANDLNGGTATIDLTGAAGAMIIQINSGAAGTLGIDVIQVGDNVEPTNWKTAVIRDSAGAVVANAALNAAGVEPTGAAVFTISAKDNQLDGPVRVRCVRNAADAVPGTSVAWTTGAPQVAAIRIG